MRREKHILALLLAICLVVPMFVGKEGMAVYAEEKYEVIPEGVYILKNKESGKVLDVYGKPDSSKNKANVQIYKRHSNPSLSQQFQVKKMSGGWYSLIPLSNKKLAVNAYSNTPKNGTNVNAYTITKHDSQGWYFEKAGDYYIVRCAYNKKIVLTEDGKKDLSNVKLATYKSGKASQLWSLELVSKTDADDTKEKPMDNNMLLFDWNKIAEVGSQDIYSYACACFALAYCRTILDGTAHQWYEYNQNGGTNQLEAFAQWLDGGYSLKSDADKNKIFREAYVSINSGRPVIFSVTADSEQHYVAVVGYMGITSLDSLSESNFLIIDPAYGSTINEPANLGEKGYELRAEAEEYRCLVTGEGGVITSSTAKEDPEVTDTKDKVIKSNSLVIDWGKIKKVGNQAKKSYACSCFALAYCRTILDGKVHQWHEYNKKKIKNELNVSAQWYAGNYNVKYSKNKKAVFQAAYKSINAGRPVIFYVTSSRGHYVVIVGYTNVKSLDSLNESNFLMIDTIYGSTKSKATNLGKAGYKLKKMGKQYCYLTTSKGKAKTTAK